MAMSRIDLCSRALLKIGANPISSFGEGTAEADVASNLYDYVRDALLSAHPWHFATTQKKLAAFSGQGEDAASGGYALPVGCLRVLSAGSFAGGSGLVYRLSNRTLHTAATEVYLTYVFRPDEADFPPFFDKVLIAYLAAEFCIPLTDSTSRWESLRKIAEDDFRQAKLINAQQVTPARIDDFSLVEARY
jgi:hypothetical protein